MTVNNFEDLKIVVISELETENTIIYYDTLMYIKSHAFFTIFQLLFFI